MDVDRKYMIMPKSLRKELEDYVSKTNAKWEIVEQDYILPWVLYGISQIDSLNEHLIFKGETALKKAISEIIDSLKI